jgi:hypothetical protein
MFVQATKSRRQDKTYVSYLVRESFRTSQGPRSRTVCNISALPVEQASGTLLVAACGLDQRSETFDEDDLYQAMDGLNGRWVPIEKKLYARLSPKESAWCSTI